MNPKAIAQIAQHLNVAPNQVKRCEEWANVWFVVVHGCRPRFVSKKVVKMESFDDVLERLEREQEDRGDKAEAMAAKIADMLPVGHCVQYQKLFSAAVEVLEKEATIEEVVARLSSKKVIIKRG